MLAIKNSRQTCRKNSKKGFKMCKVRCKNHYQLVEFWQEAQQFIHRKSVKAFCSYERSNLGWAVEEDHDLNALQCVHSSQISFLEDPDIDKRVNLNPTALYEVTPTEASNEYLPRPSFRIQNPVPIKKPLFCMTCNDVTSDLECTKPVISLDYENFY